MVTKDQIFAEIVRTAKENGGSPLGIARFRAETGIRDVEWQGKFWARWGDALKEAGLVTNSLQQAYSADFMMGKLASLARGWSLSREDGDSAKDPFRQDFSQHKDIPTSRKQNPIGGEACPIL